MTSEWCDDDVVTYSMSFTLCVLDTEHVTSVHFYATPPIAIITVIIMSQPATSEAFYMMAKQSDVSATYTLLLNSESTSQWFALDVSRGPDQHAFIHLSLSNEPSTTFGFVKYVIRHLKGEPGKGVGVSFVECDPSDKEFQPTMVSDLKRFYDTPTDNQQGTPIIAEGELSFDDDKKSINLADATDIGRYVIKIMPDMCHQVFNISTLRLDIKTYYCDARDTPRAKFLEKFTKDSYRQHGHRLVTSHKTLEELNEEDDDYERTGSKTSLIISEEEYSQVVFQTLSMFVAMANSYTILRHQIIMTQMHSEWNNAIS